MRTTSTLVLFLIACNTATSPVAGGADTGSAEERFASARDIYYRETMGRAPGWAVHLGYHEYDGLLSDSSPDVIAMHIADLRRAEATFTEIPEEELSPVARIEREALLANIRSGLFELEVLQSPTRDPIGYAGGLHLAAYITRDYAPLADRARAIIQTCEAAGPYYEQAMGNLERSMPRPWIEIALLQVSGMLDFIKTDIPPAVAGLDPDTAAELDRSLALCTASLQRYKQFLEERQAHATSDYALGEELFLRMLRDREGIDISIDRLLAVGQADFDRNAAAMVAAARAIDPNRSVNEVIAALGSDKPSIERLFALAEEQAAATRQMLIDRRIVSIPRDDVAEVRESPAFMRWNSAFLGIAGPFEQKPLPSFYYISPPDPSWPADMQKAYIPFAQDLLFTTVHELWPGHFLHSLHIKKNPSPILKSFCSYATMEGWAHYTEEMMWDEGLGGGDPAVHVGQLANALLRNARFMSAIGLHARGMTVDQSIELFAQKAYADPGTALQQAKRGTFDPGYLNYTLGKLMIKKLRDDWKAKVGDRYSLQAFHDEFLSYACAPIPVIRRFMLGPDAGPAL